MCDLCKRIALFIECVKMGKYSLFKQNTTQMEMKNSALLLDRNQSLTKFAFIERTTGNMHLKNFKNKNYSCNLIELPYFHYIVGAVSQRNSLELRDYSQLQFISIFYLNTNWTYFSRHQLETM